MSTRRSKSPTRSPRKSPRAGDRRHGAAFKELHSCLARDRPRTAKGRFAKGKIGTAVRSACVAKYEGKRSARREPMRYDGYGDDFDGWTMHDDWMNRSPRRTHTPRKSPRRRRTPAKRSPRARRAQY